MGGNEIIWAHSLKLTVMSDMIFGNHSSVKMLDSFGRLIGS